MVGKLTGHLFYANVRQPIHGEQALRNLVAHDIAAVADLHVLVICALDAILGPEAKKQRGQREQVVGRIEHWPHHR